MKPLLNLSSRNTGIGFKRYATFNKPLHSAGAYRTKQRLNTVTNGWTGTENCAIPSLILVTVDFDTVITFTDDTGVTISHSYGTFSITSSAAGTGNTIEYTGTWDIAPTATDSIQFSYDSTAGNYTSATGSKIVSLSKTLTNCETI